VKEKKPKRNLFYRISFWLMIYCLFSLTFGHLIPIYFQDNKLREDYYLYIYVIFIMTLIISCFNQYYKPEKKNGIYVAISSVIIGAGVFLIAFFFVILSSVAEWTDAGTVYVNKANPNVKIISRYINEGAFGGGTEPGDYETVVLRPITPLLKIETSIDTTKMDKSKWIRQVIQR